jgi:hypothetical protein
MSYPIISWQEQELLMRVSSNLPSCPPQKPSQASKQVSTLSKFQLCTPFHSPLPTLFPRVLTITTESWSWCQISWREMTKTYLARILMEKWEVPKLSKLQQMKISRDVQAECAMELLIQVTIVLLRLRPSSSLLEEQTTRSQLEWLRNLLYKPRFKIRLP